MVVFIYIVSFRGFILWFRICFSDSHKIVFFEDFLKYFSLFFLYFVSIRSAGLVVFRSLEPEVFSEEVKREHKVDIFFPYLSLFAASSLTEFYPES